MCFAHIHKVLKLQEHLAPFLSPRLSKQETAIKLVIPDSNYCWGRWPTCVEVWVRSTELNEIENTKLKQPQVTLSINLFSLVPKLSHENKSFYTPENLPLNASEVFQKSKLII